MNLSRSLLPSLVKDRSGSWDAEDLPASACYRVFSLSCSQVSVVTRLFFTGRPRGRAVGPEQSRDTGGTNP